MYLEIFLADFAVFRVFWGISRKYLNFAGMRPREISKALLYAYSVILLPLRPASLMHKNPKRHKDVNGTCPVKCKDGLIDQPEDIFAEYPVHVISVAVPEAVV